uniref:Uncharacterized protein n=1 Tax=Rousettus aegyptiacus TaxID=9407 RepID=A0A7J8BSA9_ROUAE|nr:hypothetical protein HJG63_009603 [Rousettus aegyptiacus]
MWTGEGGETWKGNGVGRTWSHCDRGLKHPCRLFFPRLGSLPPTEEHLEPSRVLLLRMLLLGKAEPWDAAARWPRAPLFPENSREPISPVRPDLELREGAWPRRGLALGLASCLGQSAAPPHPYGPLACGSACSPA